MRFRSIRRRCILIPWRGADLFRLAFLPICARWLIPPAWRDGLPRRWNGCGEIGQESLCGWENTLRGILLLVPLETPVSTPLDLPLGTPDILAALLRVRF